MSPVYTVKSIAIISKVIISIVLVLQKNAAHSGIEERYSVLDWKVLGHLVNLLFCQSQKP